LGEQLLPLLPQHFSTLYDVMAAILKAWRQIGIRLLQSMRIYIAAKFHPDPIWNDGPFGF